MSVKMRGGRPYVNLRVEDFSSEGEDSSDAEEASGDDDSSSEEEWEVEKILGVRHGKDGDAQYLVKWKGWAEEESTWEPSSNVIHAMDLVEAFHEEEAKKNRRTSRSKEVKSNKPTTSRASSSSSSPSKKRGNAKRKQLNDEIKVEVRDTQKGKRKKTENETKVEVENIEKGKRRKTENETKVEARDVEKGKRKKTEKEPELKEMDIEKGKENKIEDETEVEVGDVRKGKRKKTEIEIAVKVEDIEKGKTTKTENEIDLNEKDAKDKSKDEAVPIVDTKKMQAVEKKTDKDIPPGGVMLSQGMISAPIMVTTPLYVSLDRSSVPDSKLSTLRSGNKTSSRPSDFGDPSPSKSRPCEVSNPPNETSASATTLSSPRKAPGEMLPTSSATTPDSCGEGVSAAGQVASTEGYVDPGSLEGTLEVNGQRYFVVKWPGMEEMELIPEKEANVKWPQSVIKFYESITEWR